MTEPQASPISRTDLERLCSFEMPRINVNMFNDYTYWFSDRKVVGMRRSDGIITYFEGIL
jgi:hypothetical protein